MAKSKQPPQYLVESKFFATLPSRVHISKFSKIVVHLNSDKDECEDDVEFKVSFIYKPEPAASVRI